MEVRIVESENEVYQKEKLLGQGAFGKAYLVRKKQTGELLVIKEVSIDHMSQKEQEETIKQAQILRTFKHPLIVRFIEVYATKQNKLKIVMEYAECGDLSKAVAARRSQKKPFQESQILDWFTQICLAMKHVHDRKILHRDIKGQNIFITKANTLKLGDFGIARVLNKTQDKARTVVGTPYYLSPEIIENKPYSFKSDIWSMGVLLYQLCALTPPFNANSLQLLALKIVKGGYQPITGNYSKELKGLIAEILQVDPNKRPLVRDILERPFIKERIQKFLSQTSHKIEFSHTILHNHKVQISNKLIKVQEDKRPESQRQRLKEQAAILKEKLDRKKEEERVRQQERLRKRREEENLRRQEQNQKRRQHQLKIKEIQQRKAAEQRKQWIQRQKKKQQANRQYQLEQQRKRVMEIAEFGKKRQRQERQLIAKKEQLLKEKLELQRQRESQVNVRNSRLNKQKQQNKRIDQLNEFARKQWYENQMIRKRAQERAKQSEMQSYTSQPSHVQQIQKEPTRPQSIKDKNNNARDSKQKKNFNQHEVVGHKKHSLAYQPSEEQIQNALINPNFGKKSPAVKIKPDPKPVVNSWSNKPKQQVKQKEQSKAKKADETREQMRRDRQEFLKAKNQGIKNNEIQQQVVETLKPGKWQKRSSKSREKQEDNSSKNSRVKQTTPIQESIMNSADLKLNIKDEEQLKDYLAQLQGILNNVHKKIQKLDPLPEIPVAQEIIMRDDDNEELDYSITASFDAAIQPPINNENADFDLFSDYSKLEELRMSLEDKFGTDQFVKIYRVLESELQSKGLEYFNFNIYDLQEKLGKVDKKLILDNLPMLLTLIVMEEKMSY